MLHLLYTLTSQQIMLHLLEPANHITLVAYSH